MQNKNTSHAYLQSSSVQNTAVEVSDLLSYLVLDQFLHHQAVQGIQKSGGV